MRCKKHPLDQSGHIGVCASCLRERLFILVAAQAQSQSQQSVRNCNPTAEDRRKQELHPPSLIFPRSVSPYISRRKSDYATTCHPIGPFSDRMFYSTPQIGPDVSSLANVAKKKSSRFGALSRFFRAGSEKLETDPRNSRDPTASSPATSSSSSWFPSLFVSGSRKSKLQFTPGDRRPCRAGDRGMSPERTSCDGDDYEKSTGYSSDSSEKWKRTPVTAPASISRRVKPSHGRNVTGMVFCLSPLVRASPNRNWNQKGLPPENGFPGEIRVPAKSHLSSAGLFCKNRSRKLADFGRFSNHR